VLSYYQNENYSTNQKVNRLSDVDLAQLCYCENNYNYYCKAQNIINIYKIRV